jgi:hypothetical protein
MPKPMTLITIINVTLLTHGTEQPIIFPHAFSSWQFQTVESRDVRVAFAAGAAQGNGPYWTVKSGTVDRKDFPIETGHGPGAVPILYACDPANDNTHIQIVVYSRQ